MTCAVCRTTVYAADILSSCSAGTVHSVYRKTVNLQWGASLLALQADGSPLSPLSLITSLTEAELSALPLAAGQTVRIAGSIIQIGSVCFDLSCAERIDLSLPPGRSHNCTAAQELIQTVLQQSETHGFRQIFCGVCNDGPLDETLILTAAQAHLTRSRQALQMQDFSLCAQELTALIGLGIGLTPSGDDFLCGVLAGCTLCGLTEHPFAVQLRQQTLRQLSRTNDISGAFLRCAVQGQFSQAVSLLSRSCPLEEITAAFQAIGHSSGMDTLCGVLYLLQQVPALLS